jgi:phosphoglycolate phosphatase-like HAD superfamily hydrolase
LPYQDIPYAFSDDAIDRESIAQPAQSRAEKTYGCQSDTVTYVGDGVWDIWTAQKLGFEFILRFLTSGILTHSPRSL